MNGLFFFKEIFTNGYNFHALDLFFLVSILCGIFVIISKNPIVSVLFLIGLFLSIASYLILIGIDFIGLSYILVYVGAVSILFLFILMLINVRLSELLSNTSTRIPLAIITSVSFNLFVSEAFPYYFNFLIFDYSVQILHTFFSYVGFIINVEFINYVVNIFNIIILNTKDIYFATSQQWDGALFGVTQITSLGNVMYSNYSIFIILVSIILLLGMVGTIAITIKKKEDSDT
jgi:NADH-ubiquinone oxidoreductase chain 6